MRLLDRIGVNLQREGDQEQVQPAHVKNPTTPTASHAGD